MNTINKTSITSISGIILISELRSPPFSSIVPCDIFNPPFTFYLLLPLSSHALRYITFSNAYRINNRNEFHAQSGLSYGPRFFARELLRYTPKPLVLLQPNLERS